MMNIRETAPKNRFRNSISHKLIMRISLVFCVVFLFLFFTILTINYHLIIRNEMQMFYAYETNTLVSIDDKLKDMCRVSLMSMADQDTLDIICGYRDMDLYQKLKAEQKLHEFYSSLIIIRNDINGVYVLDDDSLIFHCDPCDASVKRYPKGESRWKRLIWSL